MLSRISDKEEPGAHRSPGALWGRPGESVAPGAVTTSGSSCLSTVSETEEARSRTTLMPSETHKCHQPWREHTDRQTDRQTERDRERETEREKQRMWASHLPPRPILRRARPMHRRGTHRAVSEWRWRRGSRPASSGCSCRRPWLCPTHGYGAAAGGARGHHRDITAQQGGRMERRINIFVSWGK